MRMGKVRKRVRQTNITASSRDAFESMDLRRKYIPFPGIWLCRLVSELTQVLCLCFNRALGTR